MHTVSDHSHVTVSAHHLWHLEEQSHTSSSALPTCAIN